MFAVCRHSKRGKQFKTSIQLNKFADQIFFLSHGV